MNRVTVAIEDALTPIAEALDAAGFTVIPLTRTALSLAQAIVVSGIDDNFLGIEDPESNAPVINAEGMTTEEVVRAVKERAVNPSSEFM